MPSKTYPESINTALKTMDAGNYNESLTLLLKVIKSENFLKLTLKEQLFIRKRTSWVQLSLGYYEDGWKNFVFNWLKNSHKFENILKYNNKIKYLISFDQLEQGEQVLIWNDGGFGDFIFQLRLLEFFDKKIKLKIFDNKMSHFIREKNLITSSAADFTWHLPVNEIPRIINFHSNRYNNFNFNYLIKPSSKFIMYNDFIGVSYKTETDPSRSINYKLLKKLFKNKKNLKFLILQKTLNKDEKGFFSNFDNVSFINDLDSSLLFENTFDIVSSVKYMITVDTAIGHISGYLGKKSFLLLQHPSVFYWGFKSKSSTDYKNHHLLRQPKPGDWDSVINDLINII